MDINQLLDFAKQATEQELATILQPKQKAEDRLYQAMEYSALAGGKRLRPALFLAVLLTFEDRLKADLASYMPFAAALEMIHTYSLIHDDLPAMDNDDLRRGKPTCHKAFDEGLAILAGDGLLTEAFNQMLSIKAQVGATDLIEAVQVVAQAAGIYGMVAGQVIDLQLEGEQADIEQLKYMIERKTGALFRAAIISAAHLCRANAQEMAALNIYSYNLGLAFQIADDILDIIGDEQKLGKPIGSDIKNDKNTFVSLLGLEAAKKAAKDAANAANAALAILGDKGKLLAQFPILMIDREI